MSFHNIKGVNVCGMSACVPQEKFPVSQYEYFSEQEKNDFIKHVGVESKRFSKGKHTAADLCFESAKKLLAELQWNASEVELLILVTQTPDYTLPASSVILQDRLGFSKKTITFDINLGCSGWVYGLSVAAGLMSSMKLCKAILLTGETSIISDYKDKSTFPLMGDAGTSTALELKGSESMIFDLNTNGSGYKAIIAPNSGTRYIKDSTQDDVYNHFVLLNSQQVLEFCLREVVPTVQSLMDNNSLTVNNIDYFVFHQANRIINESLRKKLGVPSEKFPYSLKEFANTSSASVPLTIVSQIADEIRSKKLSLLCSGFGVGLSWGSVLLKTENVICPELVEI